MTLKSTDLVPFLNTEAKLDRARAAYRGFLQAVGRSYNPRKALDLTFPENPRSGGIENNYPSTAHALMAYLIMDDRLALEQAVAIGNWLYVQRDGWDRAHRQRIPWLAAVADVADAAGVAGTEPLRAAFNYDVGRTVNEKYLVSFVGSNTRPLIRTLGAAVMLAEVAMGEVASDSLVTMRDRALRQWGGWANADWKPGVRWGWLGDDDGFWDDDDPAWKRFPYLGGGDPVDSASDDTWFHYGCVVPYEAMIAELFADLSWDVRDSVARMARHALAYGYDPSSGLTLKSIGFKKGGDNTGCMAPGFHDGPWKKESEAVQERYMEMSHFDLAPALFAAGRDREERKTALVEWGKRCRAIGREGEVPLGTLLCAIKLGFGE